MLYVGEEDDDEAEDEDDDEDGPLQYGKYELIAQPVGLGE